MLRGLCRFLLILLVGAWLPAGAAVPLSPALARVDLRGQLEWLQDDAGRWRPDEVAARTDWRALPGEPSFGFTRAAIWLKVTLHQPVGADPDWRLVFNNALLEDVRLYERQASGHWRETRAGQAVPRALWPMQTRSPTFRLSLPPGQHTLMVRLTTRPSLSTTVSLWRPEAYRLEVAQEALGTGALMGVYTLVILFQFAFWLISRESVGFWCALYALCSMVAVLVSAGHPQAAFGWSASLSLVVLGLSLGFSLVAVARFAASLLELPRHAPRWAAWHLRVTTAIGASAAILAAWVDYRLVMPVLQASTLLWLLTINGVAIWLAFRRFRPAYLFLLTLGVYGVGVLVRFLRNLGVMDPGWLTDNIYQLTSVFHLLVLSSFVALRYGTLKRELAVAQAAHQEQRDFMALVSHEFRTPLAIINTSAQQLARNLQAPVERTLTRCANIQQAARRMSNLMDDYLSLDRLEGAERALQVQSFDLLEWFEDAAADWSPERVALEIDEVPERWTGDPKLLHIVVRNLLTNADRHSPPEQEITLQADVRDNGDLRVRVIDHGEGIADDELPQVFKKYFRGRSAQGKPGAGLGLYMVERIVRLHGGRIRALPTPGGGATFEFRLPPHPGGDEVSRVAG
ncbi:hypothetical protein DEH84_04840 [Aquabacterium olei]|uniref:histidine kinase n=1 Tax=Aquabacterium olei TaxID=1296669 RepID=A0A2U8FPD0_9BURK|nr:hypothetical protein DEH84_04840 [Aquabacterium olei]